jgi:hypothetical protein
MSRTPASLNALAAIFEDMVAGDRRHSPNIASLVWIDKYARRLYDASLRRVSQGATDPEMDVWTIAHMLAGGELLVLVTCETGEFFLTIEPGRWGWRRPPS